MFLLDPGILPPKLNNAAQQFQRMTYDALVKDLASPFA